MSQPSARVAVIGGSGLYGMEGLTDVEERQISTPFGEPSDAITLGRLDDVPIAFLPRHGRGHRLAPSEVPARANIYALKILGVEWVISVSAVGSLREDYAPLDLVVPDQLFDRTKTRPNSFFEDGLVARPDGNNVSMDRESLNLAEAQLKFRTGVALLRQQYQMTTDAIHADGK